MTLFGAPRTSAACSCAIFPSVESFYAHADIVVAAEAVAVSSTPAVANIRGREIQDNSQIVTWEVLEHWKGPFRIGEFLTTAREAFAGNCTHSANQGDVKLLYLSLEEPRDISFCRGSVDLKRALRDIPELYRLSGSGDGT